ncbi:MAG: hypothetical protein ACHREM_27985 [Polyangiales bacterium]
MSNRSASTRPRRWAAALEMPVMVTRRVTQREVLMSDARVVSGEPSMTEPVNVAVARRLSHPTPYPLR